MQTRTVTSVFVAGTIALGLGASIAVADVVQERQALMKEIVSPNVRLTAEMVKGERPFDAEEAAAAMRAVSQVPPKFLELLDEGTSADDRGDSGARIAVWADMATFEARMEDLRKASLAAEDSAHAGLDPFKSAFVDVARQCRACHQEFRLRR